MGQVEALPESMTDFDWATPCMSQRNPDCPDEAVAAVWMSHNPRSCPAIMNLCQAHLDGYLQRQGEWLRSAYRCKVCDQLVTGTLQDNIRVMPL